MISIIKTFEFPGKVLKTIVHIGRDSRGILYYGEENSRIQWMPIEKYLSSRSLNKLDIKRQQMVEFIIQCQRDDKLNDLLK